MKKAQLYLFLAASLALFALSGCGGGSAIRTDAEYTPQPEPGAPAFKYGSEKDILYLHEEILPDGQVTSRTDIKVLASAAAFADAERLTAEAEGRAATAQASLEALRLAASLVPGVPAPPPPSNP